MSDIASLFEPMTIRGMTVPNRIVMAPMTRSFSPDGIPGEDVAAYYQRRGDADVGNVDRTTIEISRSLLERAIDKHPRVDVFHKIVYHFKACEGRSREDDDLLRRAGKAITILRDQCVAKLDHEVGQRVQVDLRNDGCW